MRKIFGRHFGFTLVEVSLFLAISGLLLIGIIAGTQNSINAQRFNDSVQNFVEFLRTVYSEVENPQSPGDGRSGYAIYGRLVSFGQAMTLDGARIPSYEQRVYVYDVIGNSNSINTSSGLAASALIAANANVVLENKSDSGVVTSVSYAGNVREYIPTWGSAIDDASKTNGTPYTGTILVVRHPKSGTISTLISSNVIQINQTVKEANQSRNFAAVRKMLKDNLNSFGTREVNFCVNPDGMNVRAGLRRNVRLLSNARNTSGVELINQDDLNNKCL